MAKVTVARDAITHVVALVLENRSFDHILGDLGRSGVLKVDGGRADMSNPDLDGRPIGLNVAVNALAPDLPHDLASVATSLSDSNGGFVRADQLQNGDNPQADAARVMSYFDTGSLPVTHSLAREYSVSDAWFCSVPAGTWPNRLFLIAASSDGRVTNTVPWLLYDIPTVFDRLKSDEWAVYNDQIPNVTLIRNLAIEWARERHKGGHFRSLREFDDDCAAGRLPALSYIEPVYLGDAADDAHPPRDIRRSERLLARIYGALRRSPSWDQSLLLVLYDEHGGFFDHVRPPTGVPGPGRGERGFGFSQLGVRVPCLLVSAYSPRGGVWRPPRHRFADHTSLIASVLRRRSLRPLTVRDAAAADIWDALTEGKPRRDDLATMERLDAWRSSQEAVDVHEFAGLLDPATLEGRSGREVAAAIVAAQPSPPDREPDGGLTSLELAGADVPFERALVDLAERIRDLPA